jgi:hypothetical protein
LVDDQKKAPMPSGGRKTAGARMLTTNARRFYTEEATQLTGVAFR